MMLLYFWKDTGVNLSEDKIEKEEFNFSIHFEFKYNEESKTIEYTKSKSYTSNFFSKDINIDSNVMDIVAIVGANGSGKTSFLESLINIPYTVEDGTSKFIVIFKLNNNIEYITNIENLKIEYKKDQKYIEDNEIQEYIGSNKERYLSNNLKYVYHSSIFEQREVLPLNDNLIDISTNRLIVKDSKFSKEMGIYDFNVDSKTIFFEQEFKRQIDLIHRFEYNIPNIEINLPKYSDCKFVETNNIWNNIVNGIKVDQTKIKIEYIKDAFKKIRKNLGNRDGFKFRILEGVMINYIDLITPSTVPQRDSMQIEAINKVFYDFDNPKHKNKYKNKKSSIKDLKNLDEILNFLKFMLNHEKFEMYKETNNIKMFLEEFYEKIDNELLEAKLFDYNRFIIRIKDNSNPESIRNLEQFYELYRKTVRTFDYINFAWPLSSGENNLLNLYARFLSILDDDGNIKGINGNSVIFLLDESDISFHPEWQRRFLSTFINICKTIFEKYEIQIILTTHSPILLSDIPDSNVIYIKQEKNRQIHRYIRKNKKDENPKTFGANIFNLYNDSFYFGNKEKSQLGTIGELAQSKIDNMIDILNKYLDPESSPTKEELEEQLEYCEYLISIVGEEIIKILLYDKYKQVKSKHRKLLEIDKESKLTEIIKMLQIKNEISEKDEQELYKALKARYENINSKKD